MKYNMTYKIRYSVIYVASLKVCNVRYIFPYKQQNDTLHQKETILCIAFHACLSIKCSHMGFKI